MIKPCLCHLGEDILSAVFWESRLKHPGRHNPPVCPLCCLPYPLEFNILQRFIMVSITNQWILRLDNP